jgi:hypothetical protein
MNLAETNLNKRKVSVDARPHPGPLPRGEGGRCDTFVEFESRGCIRRSLGVQGKDDCGSEMHKFKQTRQMVLPLLSEHEEPRIGLMVVHPHPNPLPQERVNRPALSNNFEITVDLSRSGWLTREEKIETGAPSFHKTEDTFTLSPGERDGVRASNHLTNSFSLRPQHSNSLLTHRPGVFGQGMRRAGLQFTKNSVPNTLPFPLQLEIPKAQFLDTLSFQKPRSLGVMGSLGRVTVTGAVQFDGEMGLHAEKIECVFPDRMPAAEFVAVKTTVAQPAPHELLGPSRLGSGSGGFLHRCKMEFERGNLDKLEVSGGGRPHPGPLPQERGNRQAISNNLALTVQLSRSGWQTQKAEIATGAQPTPKTEAIFTLSSGERAGVRANTNKNSHADVRYEKPVTATAIRPEVAKAMGIIVQPEKTRQTLLARKPKAFKIKRKKP